MDALNFLRELLSFILSSRLFQMLVALKVKARWLEVVSKKGYWNRITLASKVIVYIRAFTKFSAELLGPRPFKHL